MKRAYSPALLLILLCLAIPALPAGADHGGIPLNRHVTFDEQAQNAIVAWNGDEEVLILSTEVSSAAEGKLLEFLPHPSRPKSMTEGDFHCFWNVGSYFDGHTINGLNPYGLDTDGLLYHYYPNIQVLERVNVGPHDITVVKITATEHFNAWVQAFALARGLPSPNIPERLESCVGSYLERNILYFVFDVIDLGKWPVRVNPVGYTFDTPYLFYPLEVTRDTLSNSWRGHTISVFLVTGEKLRTTGRDRIGFGNLHGLALDEKTPSRGLEWISWELANLFPAGAYLSHVGLTLESASGLNGLRDIMISWFDFEDPMEVFTNLQLKMVSGHISRLVAPLSGPSVNTILLNAEPEQIAGQMAILFGILIFISLVLGLLMFRFFSRLGPGLDRKRLLVETISLALMLAILGLYMPYPVLKVFMALIAAFGVWFLAAVPVHRRIKCLRFERELKELLRRPL